MLYNSNIEAMTSGAEEGGISMKLNKLMVELGKLQIEIMLKEHLSSWQSDKKIARRSEILKLVSGKKIDLKGLFEEYEGKHIRKHNMRIFLGEAIGGQQKRDYIRKLERIMGYFVWASTKYEGQTGYQAREEELRICYAINELCIAWKYAVGEIDRG